MVNFMVKYKMESLKVLIYKGLKFTEWYDYESKGRGFESRRAHQENPPDIRSGGFFIVYFYFPKVQKHQFDHINMVKFMVRNKRA